MINIMFHVKQFVAKWQAVTKLQCVVSSNENEKW